ncbi:RelA/SpoT family protein [Candidatus Latescibacterota bacterium]
MAEKTKTSKKKTGSFVIEPVELIEVIDEFEKLLNKISLYNPHVDEELIKKALRFAAVAHSGQRRMSGMPFIYHGIQTAGILADLHLDSVMIACGILHDILEDTKVTIKEIRSEFGDEITDIIEGLTKIAALKLKSPEVQQAENFRKMILSTARDIRTILVKFADRLHNMRTLEFLPEERRIRIAHETLEVFSPLAHRFGVNMIKTELEDLSFRWLHEKEYKEIQKSLELIEKKRNTNIEIFLKPIEKRLKKENIDYKIHWRLKNIYSIYSKILRTNQGVEDIYDIFAMRVIVNSVVDCYHTFGIIHALFTPVVARIKDFIATPKFNMYQSLHTTVIGPKGGMVEIQIRTHEMHETAESGVAAHWRYKEGKVEDDEIDSYMEWLRKFVDWQSETPEAKEFMHELKLDLYQDEIFVFTPKGDLIQLPSGSTPVDFAFALHTEIGFHCAGAKVNGKMVTLDKVLKSSETVDILTNPNKQPSPGWLNAVKTAKARSLIRRWIKRQHYDESHALGLDMLSKIEKNKGSKINEKERKKLVEKYHQRNWDQFVANLGTGDVSLHSVQNFFGLTEKHRRGKPHAVADKKPGVSIQGMGNLLISFANCCKPLPGDDIIGFVSRGRGLVVHRSSCENVINNPDNIERAIHIQWEPGDNMFFVASIRIEAANRKSLLSDISSVIAKFNCNIRSANISTKDDIALEDFDVDVKDLSDLQKLMNEIRKIKGVIQVRRLDVRSPENIKSSHE